MKIKSGVHFRLVVAVFHLRKVSIRGRDAVFLISDRKRPGMLLAVDGREHREAVFKCKIHSISKEEIPELTDDFVKEISDFDTVDEWKADAKKKLEENAEQTAKVGFENALVAKLIDKVQDPIPHCMFEQRADSMMYAFPNMIMGLN